MKGTDLSQLQNCDQAYAEICANVAEKYAANWDDAVHDSFRRFVDRLQDNSHQLHGARVVAEQICAEVEAVPVDELVTKARELAKEADAV